MESSEQSIDINVESAMSEIYPNELRDDQEEDGLEVWQPPQPPSPKKSRKEPVLLANNKMELERRAWRRYHRLHLYFTVYEYFILSSYF